MSVHLTKAFSSEPDLILKLTGQGDDTLDDLISQNFTFQNIQDPPAEVEAADDAKEVASKPITLHVYMHTSRKHLIDASPFFKTLLQGEFSESEQESIDIKCDYAAAFARLMSLVHGQNRSLMAQEMTLTKLYEVCIVVDKRGLHDVAAACGEAWIGRLREQIPTEPSQDTTIDKWLLITFVLKHETYFRNLTALVQRQHVDMKECPDSPLPEWVRGRQLEPRENRI